MEEDDVIICEKCYEENESTRNICKRCGAKLYKGNEEVSEKILEDNIKAGKKRNLKNSDKDEPVKENAYMNSSGGFNRVANKFTTVVLLVKIFGYIVALYVFFLFIDMDELGTGILMSIGIIGITWSSTLLYEAIAEGLNLLQDIKNKLYK